MNLKKIKIDKPEPPPDKPRPLSEYSTEEKAAWFDEFYRIAEDYAKEDIEYNRKVYESMFINAAKDILKYKRLLRIYEFQGITVVNDYATSSTGESDNDKKRDKFLALKCSIKSHKCENREISYFGTPSKLRIGFRCACGMEWTIRVGELRRLRSHYPEIQKFWDGGEEELKKFASRL